MKDTVSHLKHIHTRKNSSNGVLNSLSTFPLRVMRSLKRMNIQGELIAAKDLHLFYGKKLEKKSINFNIDAFIPTQNHPTYIQAKNIGFSHCDFSARNDVSVDFTNSQFDNCTFDIRTFHNSSFIGARFHNCTFYTSTFLECDISDTQWRNIIYKSGTVDYLSCEMKDLDCTDRDKNEIEVLPHTHIRVNSLTSRNVSFCTDFEGKEGCWSQGNKKRVVGASLDFGNKFPKVPVLLFLSRDGSEGGSWKLAFMVDREVDFPVSDSRLHPGVFYSIPNSDGDTNGLIRERFLKATFADDHSGKLDYSQVQFGGLIDVSCLSLSLLDLELRPFRPASMGTPGFSEYVSESFRKMRE